MDFGFFQPVADYFLGLSIIGFIDLVLVLYLLYELYNLIKGTSGINIFFGIIAVYLLWKLVIYLKMPMLSEILGQFISVGVLAIIVVFQQEIRKFLLLLGNPRFINKKRKRFLFWKFNILQQESLDIEVLMRACKSMAASKIGALIILSGKNDLDGIVATGTKVDAILDDQLLENIFFPNSPLHDGAVIVSDNRIVAAKCILPISDFQGFPDDYGLRHRAAVGISEVSDAIAVVVSEQTGDMALAVGGELKTKMKPADIIEFLEDEFSKAKK